MADTVPNQNTVVIHRDRPQTNFLQIKNENWMEFNKKYGPFALQLYLYFTKNANNFSFALSQQAALKEIGIKKTSYHKYVDLLIDEGYLVWRNGNTYDFYETPHEPRKKPVKGSPSGDSDSLPDEQEFPFDDFRSSPSVQNFPQSNREIDNTDITNIIDRQQIGTAIQQQGGRSNRTGEAEKGFIF